MKKYAGSEQFLAGTILTVAMLSLFLPLLVVDEFLYPFVFPRTAVLRSMALVAAVAYAILLALNNTYRPRFTLLTGTFALFVGALTITAVTGIDVGHSFWSSVERSEGVLLWTHIFLLYFVVTHVIRARAEWVNLFRATVIAGWLQIIYAVGQYVNAPFALITNGERLSGAVGNPAFLSAYLIFIIGFALWLFHSDEHRGWRTASLALVGASVAIIVLTQTRGAVISLVFGGLWYAYRSWKHYSKQLRAGIALILLMLAVASAVMLFNPQSRLVILQNETVSRYTNLNPNDITLNNRLIVWGVGWRAFLERPLVGWGIENFHIPFSMYFDPAISRDIGSNSWYDRAHNIFVELGVGAGLVGIAAYLAWWFAMFIILRKATAVERPLATAALGAMLVAYGIQNLFVFDTLSTYIMLTFILAYLNTYNKQIQAAELNVADTHKPRAGRAALVGVAAALFASLIILTTVVDPAIANYKALAAVRAYRDHPGQGLQILRSSLTHVSREQEEYHFILAQYTRDMVQKKGLSSETIPLLEYTIDELEQSIKANPQTLQLYLLAAELYLDARDYREDFIDRAIAHTKRAIALSPKRFQPYTTLARIQAAQKNYAETIALLTTATQLNDRFAEGYWNLGIAYVLAGDHDAAQRAFSSAEERGYRVYTEENVKKLLGAYLDAQHFENTIAFLKVVTTRMPELTDYQTLHDDLARGYAQLYPTSTNALAP